MGQTTLETKRDIARRLDKQLSKEYVRLLERFDLVSKETIAEFKVPSVVFYAGPWPAIGGPKGPSYTSVFNTIFTDVRSLIAEEALPPELNATEEDVKRVDLFNKVRFASGKFHMLTQVLISSLPYNKNMFKEPLDEQSKIPSFFSLVKREALAEGVADLFLKELEEPYSNALLTSALRDMVRHDLESRYRSIANEESKDVRRTIVSLKWAACLQYRGPGELRDALRKPLKDTTNKCEETIYQKLTKWWEEGSKETRQRVKSGR